MDKFTDATLGQTPSSSGIYSQSDIYDLESIEKVKHAVDITLMCSKVCFKDYLAPITPAETQCHAHCFDNIYAALLYTQNAFYTQLNQ